MASTTADHSAAVKSTRSPRHNRRKKIQFADHDAARLRLAARSLGLDEAAFMRRAVLRDVNAWEATATAPPMQKAAQAVEPAPLRKKLFLSKQENELLKAAAKAAGLQQKDYMRAAVVAALTNTPPPRRKLNQERDRLANDISTLGFQLKKLGTNLNQLAKQANTGLVPVTDAEIRYFQNMHQRLMTMIAAALEKVLA